MKMALRGKWWTQQVSNQKLRRRSISAGGRAPATCDWSVGHPTSMTHLRWCFRRRGYRLLRCNLSTGKRPYDYCCASWRSPNVVSGWPASARWAVRVRPVGPMVPGWTPHSGWLGFPLFVVVSRNINVRTEGEKNCNLIWLFKFDATLQLWPCITSKYDWIKLRKCMEDYTHNFLTV